MTERKEMTLDQRLEKARECRACGRNCAQAVAMAFTDVTGLDDDTTARVTNALGAGVGGTGEICGVANAMAIVVGLMHDSNPVSKATSMKATRCPIDCFKDKNDGKVACRDLKAPGARKSCEQLIMEGIEILHDCVNR